jgi:IS30 family transposase
VQGLFHGWIDQTTDLSVYSQEVMDAIAGEINKRPRKSSGVLSLLSVNSEMLVHSQPHSTLVH